MGCARETHFISDAKPQEPDLTAQNTEDIVIDMGTGHLPNAMSKSEIDPLLDLEKQNPRSDLTHKPAPGWLRWMATGLYHSAGTIKDGVVHTLTHPISSVLGLGTSAQSVMSAVANVSHTDPKDINDKWWESMTIGLRFQSMITFIFSLYVNFPVNKKFIEDAFSKLKTNSKDTFHSFTDFIDNVSSIFLGLNSGMAAAAITFEAFLWITTGGIIIPLILAALSFLMASTSRYMGNKRVFSMLKSFFSHDGKIERQSIDALKHVKMDCKLQLEDTEQSLKEILQNLLNRQTEAILQSKRQLDEKEQAELQISRQKERARIAKAKSIDQNSLSEEDKAQVELLVSQKTAEVILEKCKLSDNDYEDLFKALISKLAELEELHPDNIDMGLFSEKQIKEYLADYAGTLCNMGLALLCGVSSGAVYMQKGYDAVNIVTKYLASTDLKDLDIWYKRLIGSSSGLASGLLYGASAADFPHLFFVALPTYLYDHPKQIFSALFLLVANYYASASMQSVTTGVVDRKDNILGLLSDARMKEILPYFVRTGCGFVNIIAELKKYAPVPQNPNQPTVTDILQHFEDPSHHRIQHETAMACSVANHKLSFFKKTPRKQTVSDHPDLRHSATNTVTI